MDGPVASAPESAAAPGAGARPLRVLFVVDHVGYPGGVAHGLGTYLGTALPALARRGIEVGLGVLGAPHRVAADFTAQGVTPAFFGRAKWDPRALLDIDRLAHRHRADLLHLCNFKAMLLGRAVARRAGLPAVLHFHDTQPVPAPIRVAQRRLLSWPHAALAVSGPVRDWAAITYGMARAGIVVLHNGIDLERLRDRAAGDRTALRAALGVAPQAPVVAIVGRLMAGKGHRLLIKLMPALLRAQPEAVLLVVGDGPERAGCEALAARLGLGAAVRFLGQRDDVPRLLVTADVVALPSKSEGLPFALLEAAALGRPAVAFDVGGVAEIVRHGRTGFLLPPGDARGFTGALVRLLGDPRLAERQGEAARCAAAAFDVVRHAARLEAVYRQALGHGQRATPVRRR